MHIQWYPGHMHKAGKEIKKLLPQIDLIIEILDARIPFSSENPMIAKLRGDKPCIKILNKNDLADPKSTKTWQNYLETQKNVKTLALSLNATEKTDQIPSLCRKLIPNKKNLNQNIQCMILGIPNVGKSTLINTLAGKVIAKTGNEPAVTKNQQRIKIAEDIVLFDTPGVLWPNVENQNSGFRLAISGAIKDTVLAYDELAHFAAEYLISHYPKNLQTRFKLDQIPDTEIALLEMIGKNRGCLRAGGHIDYDKIGKLFIQEIRSGALGQITFENPGMIAKELAQLEKIRAQKAAKKAARLARKKQPR